MVILMQRIEITWLLTKCAYFREWGQRVGKAKTRSYHFMEQNGVNINTANILKPIKKNIKNHY